MIDLISALSTVAGLAAAAGLVVVTFAAAVLLGLALVAAGQCLVGALTAERCRLPSRPPGRVAILVPAHDEEAGIAATVVDLRRQLRPGDRLLVVADNCADRTAAVARAAGAEVIERQDPRRRGKGHALARGVEVLAADPPEVVVIVDADCRLSPGAALTLAGHAASTGRPIQADYVLSPADPSARSATSALAFLVRNRVRPRALAALGLPCQLTGSGMAFPWALVAHGPLGGAHLVEDLLVGVEFGLRGRPPLACVRAHVSSRLADRSDPAAAATQRTRWEHGHLVVLRTQGPRLLREAMRQRRLDLLAQALDLAVPPLSLLTLLLLATAGAAAVAGWTLPLALAAAGLGALALGLGAAWCRFGREVLPARRAILGVPGYVLWKLPIYAAYALRGAERRWVRTRRGPAETLVAAAAEDAVDAVGGPHRDDAPRRVDAASARPRAEPSPLTPAGGA